jgi:hypothetical protein
MSKNQSERKTMPGQGEDQNRDTQQGQHKEGQKGMGSPDWKKDKEHKGQQGQHGQQGQRDQQGQQGQQQPHRQGETMGQGQQPKQTNPNKQRQGGTDTEETGERKRA